MRRLIRLLCAVALPMAVIGVAGPQTAHATSGTDCLADVTYGTTCSQIQGTGLQVDDVIGYYVPPTRAFLSNHTWSFELTTYNCNPAGLTKSQCPPKGTHYSTAHTGNPPLQGSSCLMFGSTGFSYQNCVNYGLGEAVATHGDWPTYSVPHTYSQNTWMCIEIAVKVNGTWVDNGPAHSKGFRSCHEVYS